MKSRLIALAAMPALCAPFASTAHAATSIPSIQMIETQLCPVGGAGTLRLGLGEAQQDPALRRTFSVGGAAFVPFTEARAVYTPWSGKLSALEFNGASPDGDDNQAFLDGMVSQLEANGWVSAEAPKVFGSFMMNPLIYAKDLPTTDGPRRFVLQFDAPGAVLLTCAGLDLLKLGEDENQEQLAPGSERPVAPPADDQPLANLRPQDCDNPDFRARLMASLTEGDRSGVTSAADRASDQEGYQTRLRTWLRWKMIGSGKVDAPALWDIEEKIAPMEGAQLEKDFIGFADGIVAIETARKKGDAAAECRGMVALVAAETGKAGNEAARLAKVNVALEAEAMRLGIALD